MLDADELSGVSEHGDVLAGVREALGPESEDSESPDTESSGTQPIGVVCERAGRIVLKTLAEAGGVTELSSSHEAVSAHHGNNYAPLMERYYRSHRSVLFTLLEALELEATTTDYSVLEAVEFLRANRHRVGEYLPDHREGRPVEVSFAGEMWQAILRDQRRPGRLRRRHFERGHILQWCPHPPWAEPDPERSVIDPDSRSRAGDAEQQSRQLVGRSEAKREKLSFQHTIGVPAARTV